MEAPPVFSGDVFAWLTNPVPLAEEPAFRVDGLSATDGTMFPWNEVCETKLSVQACPLISITDRSRVSTLARPSLLGVGTTAAPGGR